MSDLVIILEYSANHKCASLYAPQGVEEDFGESRPAKEPLKREKKKKKKTKKKKKQKKNKKNKKKNKRSFFKGAGASSFCSATADD